MSDFSFKKLMNRELVPLRVNISGLIGTIDLIL